MDGAGANTRYRDMVLALYSGTLAVGNVLLGTLILAGGARRFAGPSFAYVLDLAPFWFWGCAYCFAGVATLGGQLTHLKWPVRVGHNVAGLACLFWVGAFIKGATVSVTPLTGIAAYLVIGVLHCMAAGLTPRWPGHGRR